MAIAAPAASRPVGFLADGTPFYAPLGEFVYDEDEDRLVCHLCGGFYRLIGSTHLRAGHGWTLDAYREAFYLPRELPTCAKSTSRTLAAQTTRRIAAGELRPRDQGGRQTSTRGRGTPRSRSLGALHPELVAQLHPTRNANLDPFRIAARSGVRLWWHCGDCGVAWRAPPHERSRGTGCPRCARHRASAKNRRVSRERSLALMRSDLAAQLHPERKRRSRPRAPGRSVGNQAVVALPTVRS